MSIFLVKVISHVVINESDLQEAKKAFKYYKESKELIGEPISFHNETANTTHDVVGICEVSGIPITEEDEYHSDSESGIIWLKELGE